MARENRWTEPQLDLISAVMLRSFLAYWAPRLRDEAASRREYISARPVPTLRFATEV